MCFIKFVEIAQVQTTDNMLLKLSLIAAQFIAVGAYCQNSINAGGGTLSGSGGSGDYSIGDVFYITASGAGGTATTSPVQFMSSQSVGLAKTTLSKNIAVYPNPTSNFLHFDWAQQINGNVTITLFDFSGKLLKKQEVNALQQTLDLSDLQNAMYLLIVKENEQTVATYKVIKN